MADDFDPNDPVFVTMKPPKGVDGRTAQGNYPTATKEAFENVYSKKGWTLVKDSETADPTPTVVPPAPNKN